MNLVLLNHWFGQGATEVKLIEFHVEDEGCPHIVFSVHTPINFLHGAEARMVDILSPLKEGDSYI